MLSITYSFRQHYSTSHALSNITENIRKALDNGTIGCGVLVDVQKASDTVSKIQSLWDLRSFKWLF